MSDVYENCPAFENDKFLLRFSQLDDAEDLVSVYSDKNALPFFNSDNCHGDNFYYPNEDRMRQAIKFGLVPIHPNGLSGGQLLTKKSMKLSARLKCFIVVQTTTLIMWVFLDLI